MNDFNKFINYLEISDFCNAQHMLNNNFDINSVDYNKYNLLMMLINENIKKQLTFPLGTERSETHLCV